MLPTVTDPRLRAAIVDRLTFGGNIIEPDSDPYRLDHTKARQQVAASALDHTCSAGTRIRRRPGAGDMRLDSHNM